MTGQQLLAWADPAVSPAGLDTQGVSRRGLLRSAGLFGAAFATGSLAMPAAASDRRLGGDDPRLAQESFYVRPRGSDGHRNGAGYLGAAVDPHGPIPHEPGHGDPWADTRFSSNPVFVGVVG